MTNKSLDTITPAWYSTVGGKHNQMNYDSPSPDYYEPPDDVPNHNCRGVWCLDSSHQDDDNN